MGARRSFPADAVHQHDRVGVVLAVLRRVDRVGLEVAEMGQRRLELDARHRRELVVALGEVDLGLIGREVFEELDRVGLVRGVDGDAGAADVGFGAPAVLPAPLIDSENKWSKRNVSADKVVPLVS